MNEIERNNVNPSYGLLEDSLQENEDQDIVEPVYEDMYELDIVVSNDRESNVANRTVASAARILNRIRWLSWATILVIIISLLTLIIAVTSLIHHAQLPKKPVNTTTSNSTNNSSPTNIPSTTDMSGYSTDIKSGTTVPSEMTPTTVKPGTTVPSEMTPTTVTTQTALTGTPEIPARSCRDIPYDSPSGYYTLQTDQGTLFNAYCDMSPGKCNNTRGWMRIGYLNMSEPSQSCPRTFSTYKTSTGQRFCYNPSDNNCVSTIYSTKGLIYSQVAGKITGYQYGETKAFHGYNVVTQRTLDDAYVDGVSITTGNTGHRHHIWTFASAYSEGSDAFYSYTCPCTSDFAMRHTGFIPPYIGDDYFCDTGAVEDSFGHTPVESDHLYTEHPLWDGKGCGDGSTCCQFNNPPWFCKKLDEQQTSNIELRLCVYSSSSFISEISIFIR